MKQQAYKIKSKQTLSKMRAPKLKSLKLNIMAMMFLGVVGYYIFPYGLVHQVISLPDKFLQMPLFRLHYIEIEGGHKLTNDEIITISGLSSGSSILKQNLRQAYESLLTHPWIEGAEVIRILPSKIKIVIQEKKPHAIWWDGSKFLIIDRKGDVIEQMHQDSVNKGYLLVVGSGANHGYYAIENMLFHAKLLPQVLSVAKVGNRRWDLYFRGDVLVKLPEQGVEGSINILSDILNHEIKDIAVIDLRLIPDKIYIEYKYVK